MKRVVIVVGIHLGLVEDDFVVTQKNCEETVQTCELVKAFYEIHEIESRDIDTNLVVDHIIIPAEDLLEGV